MSTGPTLKKTKRKGIKITFQAHGIDNLSTDCSKFLRATCKAYLRDRSALNKYMCCHTEIEAAEQTCSVIHSVYRHYASQSPMPALILCQALSRAVPKMTNVYITGMTPSGKLGFVPRISPSHGGCLITWSPNHGQQKPCEQEQLIILRVPTRMVYLNYISCLKYTILVGNPKILPAQGNSHSTASVSQRFAQEGIFGDTHVSHH